MRQSRTVRNLMQVSFSPKKGNQAAGQSDDGHVNGGDNGPHGNIVSRPHIFVWTARIHTT